jgi:ABC-type nitrate/sulfonate/bicarbonate transport system permease component
MSAAGPPREARPLLRSGETPARAGGFGGRPVAKALRQRWLPPAVGMSTVVLVLAIVEALIVAKVINGFIVPRPSQVLAAVPRIIVEEDVLHRFAQTALEVLWASLMLAVIGIALGMLLHRFGLLRRATESWVGALASAPVVLMYPLFLVIFGRSATTIVMIGFVAGLAPVILKTVEGLAGTRAVLLDVGRTFRLSHAQLFRKILLPAALPSIFVGLRLGLIFAMINIVGVEFLINFGGLGQLINELAERYDLPGTYGAILFVVLVSVAFFLLAERLERWLRPGS